METAPTRRPYRGRFAPTPSGPLHFGSLVAALGSHLEARRHGGEWRVRIEDLDPPRVVAGAADEILRALEAFGFRWDGEVVYQSRRGEAYREALVRLQEGGFVYPCYCTRREIAQASPTGAAGPVYPGTCRSQLPPDRRRHSWRLHTGGARIRFVDGLQGEVRVDLEAELGDFVVQRADGIFAYHLALAVDDAAAGITDVVRGSDLLICTAPQILLQQRLGLPTPNYLHLPVAVNAQGQKLSKQTFARAIDPRQAPAQLAQALAFLGQPPPAEIAGGLAELWDWARENWRTERLPRRAQAPSPTAE